MILQALYQHLTYPGDFSERSFSSLITLGDYLISNRNESRRNLRNIVGDQIFRARRLSDHGHSAITMRIIQSDSNYHLAGENPAETSFCQIDHWGTGSGAMSRVILMAELLRLTISGYVGMWASVPVISCVLESQIEAPVAPDNVDVYWTARMSQTWKIRWCRGAAEYSVGSVVAEGELTVL